MSDFNACLPITLEHEGAEYTDDPDDGGGPSKWGICLNYDGPALSEILGRPATAEDIQAMTPELAAKIYKPKYWDHISLDQVQGDWISLCMFDMGVLIGEGDSSGVGEMVQAILGTKNDGIVGPLTVKAINSVNERELCTKFLNHCIDNRHSVVAEKPNKAKFLAGWLARISDLSSRVSAGLDSGRAKQP